MTNRLVLGVIQRLPGPEFKVREVIREAMRSARQDGYSISDAAVRSTIRRLEKKKKIKKTKTFGRYKLVRLTMVAMQETVKSMDDMLIEKRSSETRTGRPPGKSGIVSFPKLIGVGLTEEMYDELKEVAGSEYRTVAAQVRFFVKQGLISDKLNDD